MELCLVPMSPEANIQAWYLCLLPTHCGLGTQRTSRFLDLVQHRLTLRLEKRLLAYL